VDKWPAGEIAALHPAILEVGPSNGGDYDR
jgi:hypothetical protein